jgi:arylformamidase
VLLSGIYDLRPLVPTYVNEPLGLDDAGAWACSPLALDLRTFGPTLCVWGDNETDSFKWQSARLAQALRRAGQEVESVEVVGRNHFDLLGALGEAGNPLGSRVRAWLARGARHSDASQ